MCQISNEFKLCTCGNIAKCDHYWTLDYASLVKQMVVGEFIAPASINRNINKLNKKTILDSLNSGTAFDFDYIPSNKDFLKLYFKVEQKDIVDYKYYQGTHICYTFEFINGHWKSVDYYNSMPGIDNSLVGKITNPF